MKHIVFVFIVFIGTVAKGQNIFPEKFQGCITDHFALESDSTNARISDYEFIQIVFGTLDEKTKQKIRGVLSMQIIVDTNGKSCLLSIENKTNIPTSKLRLKKTIDNNLEWEKPTEKVAAIIVIYFNNNKISLKRLGMHGDRGWHELTNPK